MSSSSTASSLGTPLDADPLQRVEDARLATKRLFPRLCREKVARKKSLADDVGPFDERLRALPLVPDPVQLSGAESRRGQGREVGRVAVRLGQVFHL